MTLRTAMLLLRRAAICAVPGIAIMIAGTAANAQSADAHASSNAAFSSSADRMSSDGTSVDGVAAAPAPAAGAQDNSYGYHHRSWGSRLAFEAGGGANGPVSDSSNYITWGGNFTVGAGYKINPHLSALIEYQFIDDKIPGVLIGEAGATGGNAHIWSFGIAPVVDLFPKRTNDIYITGGGGFYRKVTNFTDPEEAEYCEYYYCSVGVENVVVGHFSSNQGGWNVGGGFTHRLGGIYGDGTAKLFAEVRYLDVMTPAVNGITPNGLGETTVGADTKLIPITLGVRF